MKPTAFFSGLKTHRTDIAICFGLFIIALCLRLLWVGVVHPPPFSDMEDYYVCGLKVLRGEVMGQSADRIAYRAPLYPTFIAAVSLLFASTLQPLRIIQAVLGALSPVLLYSIARLWLTPMREFPLPSILKRPHAAPALIGLMFAFMSEHIFFTGLVMTETLYVFGLLMWILIGTLAQRNHNYWLYILFSALLGGLALVRPISLFFIPIVAFSSLAGVPQEKWRHRLWAPMFAWIAPILPWTIRNFVLLGSLVLITTNSGVNFYIGQHINYSYYHTGDKETIRKYLADHGNSNEVTEDRLFLKTGLQSLSEHPLSFFSRAVQKMYYLYVLQEPPWPWAEYPTQHRGAVVPGLVFPGSSSLPIFRWNPVLLLLAATGIVYAWMIGLRQGLPLSMLALYSLACILYFARTRYRMPLDPILLYYAMLGAASLVDGAVWGYGKWLFRRPSSRAKSVPYS
ncbi:MAG: hypothetical protein P9L94_19865 [Candidatus Hinthialibacter antarcticus]|nr:hypothetical protein [Candidatus Hinthialibacter antarcticus]